MHVEFSAPQGMFVGLAVPFQLDVTLTRSAAPRNATRFLIESEKPNPWIICTSGLIPNHRWVIAKLNLVLRVESVL